MKQRITRRILSGCSIAVVIIGMMLIGGFKSFTLNALGASSAQPGSILNEVQSRGILNCGVNSVFPGFGALNATTGQFEGFDIDYCKAVASALFNDPTAVLFFPLTAPMRFKAITDKDIDVLIRNTTWTFLRDTSLGADFTTTTFYDGQGFLAHADLGIDTFDDLFDRTICVIRNTISKINLENELNIRGIAADAILEHTTVVEAITAYEAGICDVYTSDISQLMILRTTLNDPIASIILTETISKEPLGPFVSEDDPLWSDFVSWVVFCTIAADEFGISSQNPSPIISTFETERILGNDGNLGSSAFGINDAWCLNVIEKVGNYGEVYNANFSGLRARANTLNELWTRGGLLYAPPFR